MSYPTEISPRLWSILEPIESRLLDLRPGTILTLQSDARALNQVRYALYVWLAHKELSKHFRVKTVPARKQVVVERLAYPQVSIVEPADELSRIANFVCDNLLECADENSAIERIRRGVINGDLRQDEATECLVEWKRKCYR
jgi:hypothetical protein